MRRIGLLLCLLVLLLAACSPVRGMEVVSGEVLSPEEQQSLFEERLEGQPEPDVNAKGKVYWTPNGSKYHKDPACSYLKNAKQVQSGTVAEATNNGASSPCSRCGGG